MEWLIGIGCFALGVIVTMVVRRAAPDEQTWRPPLDDAEVQLVMERLGHIERGEMA